MGKRMNLCIISDTQHENKYSKRSSILLFCWYISNLLQAKVGRHKELEGILQRLRGENTGVAQEAAEIRVTVQLFYMIEICIQ